MRRLVFVIFAISLVAQAIALGLTEWPEDYILRRPFTKWAGHAVFAHVLIPAGNPDFEGDQQRSPAQIFEDDRPLGPAHISFSEIATKGSGRFLYWRSSMTTMMVFSSSDGSDPNTNGRKYRVSAPDPYYHPLTPP